MTKKTLSKKIETKESENKGLYFSKLDKKNLEFIPSGSKLLDCVLGGGWPLGRMSNVVGDAAGGKCVKNGYILSGTFGLKKLDDLDSSYYKEGEPTQYTNNLAVSKNIFVNCSHLYKETINKTLLKIKTKKGFEIECSKNHPILTFDKDCETSFVKSEDLKIGDIACISKTTRVVGENVYYYIAKILGYLVANECSFEDGKISLSFDKDVLENDFIHSLDKFSVKYELDENSVILIDGNFINILNLYFNDKKITKIPQQILSSDMESQLLFLRTLFNYGVYDLKEETLSYKTSFERISIQLQLLLLNLGIICSRVRESDESWKITIESSYINLFNSLIGTDSTELNESKNSPKSEVIPNLLVRMFKDLKHFEKDDTEVFLSFVKNLDGRCITWNDLDHFIEITEPYKIYFDFTYYLDLQSSDLYFDSIVEIKEMHYEKAQTTYDVHVPEYHCFWCNGFISHNTLLAIEACANFKNKYPDGKIYYLESEAAFDKDYAEALGMPVESIIFIDDNPTNGLIKDYTIESWYENLESVIEEAKKHLQPIIYIVDSLDALSDRSEKDRKIDTGSYGANKAKKIGELFRRLSKEIDKTRMHLMIVSQVRDNIGVSFGETKTRTGGKAMDFYASQILWLAKLKKMTKTVRKQERVYGLNVRALCKKNKVGLPYRSCDYPILFGYGIDDLTSMIEFVEECEALDQIVHLIGDSKRTATKVEHIRKMDKEQRALVRKELEDFVVKLWEEIEVGFLPTGGKY